MPTLDKGLVVGTWPPDPAQGFDKQWLDEPGLTEVVRSERVSRRTWTGFTAGDQTVRVDSLLDDRDGPAIGYVFSLCSRVPGGDGSDEPGVLHVRHRGRVRAHWNGRVVLDVPAATDGGWTDERVPVVLAGPYDVLLVKVGRGSDDLGPSMDLVVRVSAPDGSALPGQQWNSVAAVRTPVDGGSPR